MKQLIITTLALLLAVGCSKKYIPTTSVRVEKTIDTITRVAPDSATIRALFECDSLGRVRLRELQNYKGLQASQEVNFHDNELKIETRWRTQYIDRVIETHDTIPILEVREITREVKHVPAFFWWCFAIALAAVGCGAWKIIRR